MASEKNHNQKNLINKYKEHWMNLTIAKKTALLFMVVILLMIANGVVSLLELYYAEKNVEEIVGETEKEQVIHEFQSDVELLLIAVDDYIITGDTAYYDYYDSMNTKISSDVEELEELLISKREKKLLDDIERNLDSIRMSIPTLISVAERKVSDSVALFIKRVGFKYDARINNDVAKLNRLIIRKANKAYQNVQEERREAFIVILITTLLVVIISILVVAFTMKYISRPIMKLVGIAQRIAARDFDVQLKAEKKDEIGMLMIAFNAMADEISKRYEELENFSYVAAHDLKSPLAAIVGSAEVLLDELEGKIDKEDEELLRNINESGNKLILLITDLLDFAKAGEIEFSKESVSINKMLESVKKDLSHTLKQKNVKFTVQDDLPDLVCDPDRLSQVWNNLISNSIKYNDKPEPEIEIGMLDIDTYEHQYCFYVKDNGIGIEEKNWKSIFEPFKRAVASPQYEGSGVGLAIVKRIVEFHNGEIWVKSEMDEGTTFYITLPKHLILDE